MALNPRALNPGTLNPDIAFMCVVLPTMGQLLVDGQIEIFEIERQ